MSINNDQLLNEMLDAEYKKIPSLFKLSKITAKIAIAAIGVSFVLCMMFIVFFFQSGGSGETQPADGTYAMSANIYNSAASIGADVYNNDYIKYAVICLAVVIVVAFWLFMVDYYEKRAYAKASDFANKLHYAEMQKNEDKLQKESFAFRPQNNTADDPAFWTFKKNGN